MMSGNHKSQTSFFSCKGLQIITLIKFIDFIDDRLISIKLISIHKSKTQIILCLF
jgi:hypothetical protein